VYTIAYEFLMGALMADQSNIFEIEMPTGGSASVVRHRFGKKDSPRLAIVSGIRGDTPEGIRIALSLIEFLRKNEESLTGCVDIYPCMNPLAAEQGSRLWPFFDVDLNRLFPGKENGHPPERVAYSLIQDLRNCDYIIEIRGARPFFQETTQALVRSEDAAALAMHLNVQVIWKRDPGPAASKTFAYQFPNTIVVEGGVGNQLTDSVGGQLKNGILYFLAQVGMLTEDSLPFSWVSMERPVLVEGSRIERIRVDRAGFFVPRVSLGDKIENGAHLGSVLDISSGDTREEVFSGRAGMVMALRVQPVVSLGTMVARILLTDEEV
jgi:predicted deacylase